MLPPQFINEIDSFLPQQEKESFVYSLTETEQPASVRLNPEKHFSGFEGAEIVPWCSDGRYLASRPSYTMDPAFWGGAYYPQEASSMVVGEIVRSLSPSHVLDLCAAPGGKTTHIASVLKGNGILVSNEVVPNRARTLVENVQRWGTGNVVVTSQQPRAFSPFSGYFDLILADVPCSGEGMFRKDRVAVEEWSPEAVNMCAARSKTILSDVWNALAPGGYIIFSTCTFNPFEDERMVEYISKTLGAEYIPLESVVPTEAVSSGAGYHFFPHKLRGEGFFVALLRKTSDVIYETLHSVVPLKRPSKSDEMAVKEVLSSDMEMRMVGDKIYCFPPSLASEIETIRSAVSPIYSGIQVGRVIGGKLKPTHPLALYRGGCNYPQSELELVDALHYLRRDTQSPELFKQGMSVVTYSGIGLGWANRIQGRVNNLYPSEQRILKTI